ncbi:MAG: polysaccharide biosynthesis protein [Chloroflexus sp.]|nr:MAG: polysaccharide biosynthesis protein [Chloroflexus sp.]
MPTPHSPHPHPNPPPALLATRAVRGSLWVVASSYWTIGFGFLANMLLMRLLSPDVYGEFALAMFFFSLFQVRSKIALNYAFAQQRAITGETLGTLFVLDVLAGWGGVLLAFSAAPLLHWLGYPAAVIEIMLVLTILSGIESLLGVFQIVLESDLHFKPISIINGIAMPLSYIPAFVCAFTDLKRYSILAQSTSFTLLSLLGIGLYALYTQRHLLRLRWRYQPTLAVAYLRFGITSGLGQAIASLTTQVDNMILGTIAGTVHLGYYDRAYRVAQWPALLLSAVLGRAAIFTYSQLRDDMIRLQRAATRVLWGSLHLAMPVALAVMLSADELVPLLFGAQWEPAIPLLRVLILLAVIRPVWDNLSAWFIGSGEPQRVVVLSAIQLLLLVLIGTPLTLMAGGFGMAIGAVIAAGFSLLIAYWQVRRQLVVDLRQVLGPPLLAALGTLLVFWLLDRLVGSVQPLWLAVGWKAGVAFGGFFCWAYVLQPALFRSQVGEVWRAIRGRGERDS